MIVVDASVAVKWVADEPDSDAAVLLLDEPLAAPSLILAEVANALWRKCRRQEIERLDVLVACRALATLSMTRLELDALLPSAADLALSLDHPVYDCFYLAAALRYETYVVTADRRFLQRATGTPEYHHRIRPLVERA